MFKTNNQPELFSFENELGNKVRKALEGSKEKWFYHLIFERVFDNLSAEQIKKLSVKADIQRSDSTLVCSNIKKYSRLQLLIEVLHQDNDKKFEKLEIKSALI
jgi:hypothetical protein